MAWRLSIYFEMYDSRKLQLVFTCFACLPLNQFKSEYSFSNTSCSHDTISSSTTCNLVFIDEVFTVPHVNSLDSTGFLWILRDSCGLQWTPNPIDLYGTFYIFWELDWTGVLSESTGIPVLLESCGLESTGLKGNPQEFMGLKEIYGHPQDSRGIHRTRGESIGPRGDSREIHRTHREN